MDAIPIALRAAAANGQYPVVIFHHARVDVVFVALHQLKRPMLSAERPISNLQLGGFAPLFQNDERDSAQHRDGR